LLDRLGVECCGKEEGRRKKEEGRMQKPMATAAGAHALRDEYTRTIAPSCSLAAETLKLKRTLSDLVNQASGLAVAEIELM
jgi:hypothetical protein